MGSHGKGITMGKCVDCSKQVSWMALREGRYCVDCYEELTKRRHGIVDDRQELLAAASQVILTTETAHNLPVAERLDIVTAECVIGMHLFRDIATALRDVFGGRSETMQKGLRQARMSALAELRLEAAQLGADAVVGVDLDYSEISGGGKNMLFLVASGTAVKLQPKD